MYGELPTKRVGTTTSIGADCKVSSKATVTKNSSEKAILNTEHSAQEHLVSLSNNWLNWQCQMTAGVIKASIFRVINEEVLSTISTWPDATDTELQLVTIARDAVNQKQGLIVSKQKLEGNFHGTFDFISCPITVNDQCIAVVSFMVSLRSEHQQNSILQLLQWGSLWFSILEREHEQYTQISRQFSLSNTLLAQSSSKLISIDVVNKLAHQLGCERVSLGLKKGLTAKLYATSNLADFDSKSNFVQQLESLMEEALEQGQTLIEAVDENTYRDISSLKKAHKDYSYSQGGMNIYTLLLFGRVGDFGAITFERPISRPFSKEDLSNLEQNIRNVALILDRQLFEERSTKAKYKDAFMLSFKNILGLENFKSKLYGLCFITAIALLNMISVPYRVTAPAFIEGSTQQLLVASQNGFIKEAYFRAGDTVKTGDVIAILDDKQLKLELTRWQSERNKLSQEYQEALVKRERTRLSIIKSQLNKVDSEIRLVQAKVERTQIRSPFEGVILSGDLSQSLGAPVEIGQLLFEVAPLDSYRLIIEVPETDVAYVTANVEGVMIASALPDQEFDFVIDKVMPIAADKQGINYFRFEGELVESSSLLRPGMQGFAKVSLAERDVFWIWTHKLFNKLKLWFWEIGL